MLVAWLRKTQIPVSICGYSQDSVFFLDFVVSFQSRVFLPLGIETEVKSLKPATFFESQLLGTLRGARGSVHGIIRIDTEHGTCNTTECHNYVHFCSGICSYRLI